MGTLCLLATTASAQHPFYWKGAYSSDATLAANWLDAPNGAERTFAPYHNGDRTAACSLFFYDSVEPFTKTVSGGSWFMRTVGVQGGGWHISTYTRPQFIVSEGAGTNVMNTSVMNANANNAALNITVGPGNTLTYLNVQLQTLSSIVHIGGGGTFVLTTSNVIWGDNANLTTEVRLTDSTFRAEHTTPIRNNRGTVRFMTSAARLQYKATPAQAKALFGTMFINTYAETSGRDYRLHAADIGGGYVEVSLIPPGTLLFMK